MTLHLLHGPNLNLLGSREPSLYGSRDLPSLEKSVGEQVHSLGWEYATLQTNHEGAMLDYIHTLSDTELVIINAGAWTHTSIALRDALVGVQVPFVEVHISRIHSRESFRHKSFLADKALAQISGFGIAGYEMAVDFLASAYKPVQGRMYPLPGANSSSVE